MSATQGSLILIAYAPALVGGDSRALAVVHLLERVLPDLRLGWTTSDDGELIPLPQRDEWVAGDGAGEVFPFLCNDDEDHLVTLTGWETPAGSTPDAPPQFEVHARLPLDAAVLAVAEEVLEAVAEGARGLWGHMTPDSATLEIALQTSPTLEGPPCPPRGLPALKLPDEIHSPEIPHRLGWLNYWSAATARSIGFPDPARDTDLLSRSRRTAAGGWVVRLTVEPLDLDNPAHLDALLLAYERFREIGGRSTP